MKINIGLADYHQRDTKLLKLLIRQMIVGIFCLLLIQALPAQSPLRLTFNRKISTSEGLSSNEIRKIIQDRYGFTWIATKDGLNRFDGSKFILYNKTAPPQHRLPDSDITDIIEEESANRLWITTASGGVSSIDLLTGSTHITPALKKLSARSVLIINNMLWLGTSNGLKVYNPAGNNIINPSAPAIPVKTNIRIEKMIPDEFGRCWVFIANYGIALYSTANYQLLASYPLLSFTKTPLASIDFGQTAKSPDQKFYFAGSSGLIKVAYNKSGLDTLTQQLPENKSSSETGPVEALNVDREGQVWFARSSQLFRALKNGLATEKVVDAAYNSQGDWLNFVTSIYFDQSENIWLGTKRGITWAGKKSPSIIAFNVARNSSAIDHAFSVFPLGDTLLLTGTDKNLLEFDTRNNRMTQIESGKSYNLIMEDPAKKILVSSAAGFFTYNGKDKNLKKISSTYPELKELDWVSIRSVAFSTDSVALIVTNANSIFIWNRFTRTLRPAPWIEQSRISNVYSEKKKRFWILTENYLRIYDMKSGAIKTILLKNPADGKYIKDYSDICESGNSYFITAGGIGLIKLKQDLSLEKIYTTADGLTNAGVFKTFPVGDSLLVITSANGLSVLNLTENKFRNYSQEDGLHSNSFEASCGILKNGKIYAGGLGGISVIDPKRSSDDPVIPVYLEKFNIHTRNENYDSTNLFPGVLRVPNDVIQATIHFTAVNYQKSDKTVFSYEIKQLNTGWIDLGEQHFINLLAMSPGQYDIAIRASTGGGAWSKTPLELQVEFVPHWYQAVGFKILLAVLALIIILLIDRYRVAQLKAIQKIRLSIADDLHEEIGSTLHTVTAFTHLAKKDPGNKLYFDQIESSLNQATADLKDIIWVLNDKEDSVEQFVEKVKEFIAAVAGTEKINFTPWIDNSAKDFRFSKTEKRNLLMIVKEGFTNSLKHSRCRNLGLDIKRIGGKNQIIISDDGNGFDTGIRSEGKGLDNIQYRAEQIQYEVEIISAKGNGTVIQLSQL